MLLSGWPFTWRTSVSIRFQTPTVEIDLFNLFWCPVQEDYRPTSKKCPLVNNKNKIKMKMKPNLVWSLLAS